MFQQCMSDQLNWIWRSNKLNIFSLSAICYAKVFLKGLPEDGSATMSVRKNVGFRVEGKKRCRKKQCQANIPKNKRFVIHQISKLGKISKQAYLILLHKFHCRPIDCLDSEEKKSSRLGSYSIIDKKLVHSHSNIFQVMVSLKKHHLIGQRACH